MGHRLLSPVRLPSLIHWAQRAPIRPMQRTLGRPKRWAPVLLFVALTVSPCLGGQAPVDGADPPQGGDQRLPSQRDAFPDGGPTDEGRLDQGLGSIGGPGGGIEQPGAFAEPAPVFDPCPAFGVDAFFACYYADVDLASLQFVRTDPLIDFDWLDGSPDPSIDPDRFSVRWQGVFEFEGDDYEFVVTADDGVRLYVDGNLVIGGWSSPLLTTHRVSWPLTRGTHQVTMEYFEDSGQASASLVWARENPPYFIYSWRASPELTGEVQLAEEAPRPVVVLDGEPTLTLSTAAAVRLADAYGIVVVDDGVPWDDTMAALLYEQVRRLAGSPLAGDGELTWRVPLTDDALPNDVAVATRAGDAVRTVRITRAAFARSNPLLQPSADSNPDRVFYSNRLFRAVVGAFFDDRGLLEGLLARRYGVAVGLGEPVDEFQTFTLDELRYVASVLEDLPEGFRNLPGLEQVVRRKNGLTNPVYPSAPAIAWVGLGYIEFMDSAFTGGSAGYTRRLVAHEMTYFLWQNVLSTETQAAFIALSGWTKDPTGSVELASATVATDYPKLGPKLGSDPGAGGEADDVWYRATSTNFVSAYAAANNPNEDFAETLSYYVYEPDRVRTIAPDKYRFITDVVDGYEYVTLVDERFTFQVFNIEPNVTFPGKITGVDVEVARSANGDNRVIATLHLSKAYGAGAAQATTRLYSTADTWHDVFFAPLDGDPYRLRAEFTMNRYMAHGYWTTRQITVQDTADNRRYEGQDQFGWRLFVDNPGEDLKAPVADTSGITGSVELAGGEQVVTVRVPVTDANEADFSGYATLQQYDSARMLEEYASHDEGQGQIVFEFPVRDYHASGEWTFREVWLFDAARNERRIDLKEDSLTFTVTTKRPDYAAPEVDIASIVIEATPRHPESPDGETDVVIRYRARDDNAGIGVVSYSLQKPTGDILYDFHYHANFYTAYFEGDPTKYADYRIELTLPPGSPPGTWFLRELVVRDKAGNVLTSNFIETGILKPIEVVAGQGP